MKRRPNPVSRWTVPDNPAMHWTDPPSLSPPSPPPSAPAASKTGPETSPQPAAQQRSVQRQLPVRRGAAAPPPKKPPTATPSTPRAPAKHPGGRETLLTDELQARIVRSIRNGAWDWVAAEANGVGRRTVYDWLQRGEGEHPERAQTDAHVQFAHAVREARAQARERVEIHVNQTDGVNWWMKGPGRDRPSEPGWTDRPATTEMPHVTIIVTDGWRV